MQPWCASHHLLLTQFYQVKYDDDIGFFVVCFQLFSLETEIVPYLYRCWFFTCDHQFILIVLGVVNQLMVSTSIIA